MLRFLKRFLLRVFFRYKSKTEGESGRELPTYVKEAARDCLSQAGLCSAWAWDGGSRPFFWNWQEEFREALIKEVRMWIREPIKPWTETARAGPEFSVAGLGQAQAYSRYRYVGEGHVESLICFFAVAKGLSDIRMVYDGDRDEPPQRVKFTTRMRDDVNVMLRLTDVLTPPKRRVWSKLISFVTYGFGDASGKGFGAALKLWNGVVFYR
jgi:hypothetical protein